ncbi:hypothetical protein PPYR_03329 [Photinus pyralis]|uniref:Trichoplein keratin filament-binding protein n=1 Tax=Photinus pyralis TaxID=7054 RepID=A0A5N4A2M5_PHOPY|nr:trichoplein keratin filament-binding protein-like [Photinus pyralis]KAB0791529.1 hypothetical protein PPYR_03329 [Photinus pyralis]
MSSRASGRSSARPNPEARIVRRREREHDHQVKWNNQVRYYKSWEKYNNKFDEWTSPRYYQAANDKMADIKKSRERKENLEKRREKLKKLHEEEERSYQVELMVKNRDTLRRSEVPSELLKSVHSAVAFANEEKRRHEAELALYHQWRNNNPSVRLHERKRGLNEMKLSWLDQQIQKRLDKERQEEECRRLLAERQKWLDQENEKEELLQRKVAEKNRKLREELEKQMENLQLKQQESERLQREEEEDALKLSAVELLEQRRVEHDARKRERAVALENLKLHKLKLKQNADDVRENLRREQEFVKSLIDSETAERIENERKRDEVKRTMEEFLKYARDQQDLERKRLQHFDFVFDSEAKHIYEKQKEIWLEEDKARSALLRDVLETVRGQIDEKLRKNKEEQRRVLEERQSALKLVEEYDGDARRTNEEEELRRRQWKKEVELQVNERKTREAEAKKRERSETELELEKARKEEERLKQEIIQLQRRQGPIRHSRSRILF